MTVRFVMTYIFSVGPALKDATGDRGRGRLYGLVNMLARGFALLGGVVLSVLIVLTCLSIAGRSLNSILHSDAVQGMMPGIADAVLALGVGPINGDFEIVEAGMAFAIFAFLPLCQLRGAHASVDIFTSKLPVRANRVLRAVIETVFAGVLILIAIQLGSGTQSRVSTGQTTFLLQFPVWWGYALSLAAAVVAAFTGIYVAAMRVVELVTGRIVLPSEMEAEH